MYQISCCLPFFLREPMDKKWVLSRMTINFKSAVIWERGETLHLQSATLWTAIRHFTALGRCCWRQRGTCVFFPLSFLFIFYGSPSSKSFFFHSICHAICLCYDIWHWWHIFQSQKKKKSALCPISSFLCCCVLPSRFTDSSLGSIVLIFLSLSRS